MVFMKILSVQEAENVISDILGRGVGSFIDPDNTFRNKLIEKATGNYNKDIVIKFGVDPTRPDIHLGHAVILRKLRQFQDLGCKVIFLAGDFTAMIGDPTGKNKVRPEISQEEIGKNMKTFVDQLPKILKIEPIDENEKNQKITRDSSKFIVDSPWFGWMRNSEWLTSVIDITPEGASVEALTITNTTTNEDFPITVPSNTFIGKSVVYENSRMQKNFLGKSEIKSVSVINLFSILRKISYAQLIERDMFQDRIKNGEPFFMHEMLYPVIQGIDSDILSQIYGSCDLEVGGTDQIFNMLMGRRVMESTDQPIKQAVLAFELLVGLDGKEKMSKSLDNYVGITDAPNDMFGKIMSVPDSALPKYLELCTYTSMTEVKDITKKLETGKIHPKDVKMDLAEQVVNIYHGTISGATARNSFVNTFQQKGIPDDVPEVIVIKGILLVDILMREKIVSSKSEFRRLLDEGAIREDGTEKIHDHLLVVNKEMILKIGKHRFIKIIIG